MCAVVTVAGEPVQFPHDYHIEQPFITVPYHALKFGTVIRFRGKRSVDIRANDGYSAFLRKFHTLADLTFNAFLSLIIARITRINHPSHFFCSSKSFSTASFSFAFAGEEGSKHISTNSCIRSSSNIFG